MKNPHLVASPVAVTLSGGVPAGPGDVVDAHPEHDAALIATGALVPTGRSRRAQQPTPSDQTEGGKD